MSLLEDERKAEELRKAIWNERTKLSATYMNGLSIALMAIGGFTPAFSGRLVEASARGVWAIVGGMFLCLGSSLILHLRARDLLRSLR